MQNTVRTSQPTVLEALRSAFASVTNKISVRREQNYADIKFTDSVERDLAQLEYRRHGYRWQLAPLVTLSLSKGDPG